MKPGGLVRTTRSVLCKRNNAAYELIPAETVIILLERHKKWHEFYEGFTEHGIIEISSTYFRPL